MLPSVCIAQAFVESTLGEHCSHYNLWGLASGKLHYDSLQDGVYGYMNCINNQYFVSATFKENWQEQSSIIAANGYCIPKDGYYEKIAWTIENYELYEYDRQMFQDIKREIEEQKLQEELERKAELQRRIDLARVNYAIKSFLKREVLIYEIK